MTANEIFALIDRVIKSAAPDEKYLVLQVRIRDEFGGEGTTWGELCAEMGDMVWISRRPGTICEYPAADVVPESISLRTMGHYPHGRSGRRDPEQEDEAAKC